MARTYHIDIAVFAANADRKWVDNLLSHFDVPGVSAAKQGVARRISVHGIYHIALARLLWSTAGMSVDAALGIARRLLVTDANHLDLADGVALHIDRRAFQSGIDAMIAEAVESIVPRRRGRPPRRSARD